MRVKEAQGALEGVATGEENEQDEAEEQGEPPFHFTLSLHSWPVHKKGD